MSTKVNIFFYSQYGHLYRLSEAVAQGAKDVEGVDVNIFRIPETLSDEVLTKTGAKDAQKVFENIPVATVEDLKNADAVIIGAPTRFGNIASQVQNYLDQTGQLWMEGSLVGKVGSVFTSTATQHGGQETTIRNLHTSLLHHGMLIVGVPYSEQRLMNTKEVSGGSPYGASTITGVDGKRLPSENELLIARTQGKNVAEIAKKLSR